MEQSTGQRTKARGTRGAQREGDDPLVVLERQHAEALGHVRRLDQAAKSIRGSGFTAGAFETIARSGGALRDLFRSHDALEEEHLFPAVERLDPAQAKMLRDEHLTLRHRFEALLRLVGDLEGGKIHGSSVGDLLRIVAHLVTLLRRHIVHENDILYPLIRERLSPAELETLRRSMPAPEF